jgi:hypothetical protein
LAPLPAEASFRGTAPWVQPFTGTPIAAIGANNRLAAPLLGMPAAAGPVRLAAGRILLRQSRNELIQSFLSPAAVEACFADSDAWHSGR